jgi:hypothetical protein
MVDHCGFLLDPLGALRWPLLRCDARRSSRLPLPSRCGLLRGRFLCLLASIKAWTLAGIGGKSICSNALIR